MLLALCMTRGFAMDGSSFDRFAKTLVHGGSRRRLLPALAAAPLAMALSLSRGEAEAREGSFDGQLGGRHGKDRRGRQHRQRDRNERNDRNPPQSRPSGTCRPNGELCAETSQCCQNLTCTASVIGIASCQAACSSDDYCRRIYPNTQTSCIGDFAACPFIAGGKCCSRTICLRDADCQGPTFVCRGNLCRRA